MKQGSFLARSLLPGSNPGETMSCSRTDSEKRERNETDLMVFPTNVTTLQVHGSEGNALAVHGEKFLAVGDGAKVRRLPSEPFAPEPLPPASSAWSPVAVFGGDQQADEGFQ